MSHYSWTKESRTLDKKKFYWEGDVFKPSKAKKKVIIYKENDFEIYFRNQKLNISIS